MGRYGMSCQFWQPGLLEYLHPTHPLITGVGSWWWEESRQCHQCLKLTNKLNNLSTTVMIADYCPECTPRQLDLNDRASAKLSSRKRPENYYNLSAKLIPCSPKFPTQLFLDKGSSNFNWYIIPLHISTPFLNMSTQDKKAYHDRYGRWVFHWPKKKTTPTLITACTPELCHSFSINENNTTPRNLGVNI